VRRHDGFRNVEFSVGDDVMVLAEVFGFTFHLFYISFLWKLVEGMT
jgi:hypothetical protein